MFLNCLAKLKVWDGWSTQTYWALSFPWHWWMVNSAVEGGPGSNYGRCFGSLWSEQLPLPPFPFVFHYQPFLEHFGDHLILRRRRMVVVAIRTIISLAEGRPWVSEDSHGTSRVIMASRPPRPTPTAVHIHIQPSHFAFIIRISAIYKVIQMRNTKVPSWRLLRDLGI